MTFEETLKTYWGYDSFRGVQRNIIESIYEGKDTLGLMPTGGGKSVTFQVPALMEEGVCIVITPLIALMKDQVANLRKRGVKATAVYSGMTRGEVLTALENCVLGDYKFLYVSPERLSSELFIDKLSRMHVSFVTVDEAHCISQWGYDFRPSYLQICKIRGLLAGKPVLALTATATPEVVKDIQQRLGFAKENVFRMSFERQNIAYVVRRTEDKQGEMLHILESLPGTAIVYTRNRKLTKETATFLEKNGITATWYHAGLSNDTKDQRQKEWQEGHIRVMVATNAFGMGIDKPDVRYVIHLNMPDSPEAYFQEAGRAGRDGKKAYAVLLYCRKDRTSLQKRIPETFPDKTFIRQIYEHLAYYYQLAMEDGQDMTKTFDLDKFCRTFKHFPVPTVSALQILTRCGYLHYSPEEESQSRLMFLLGRDALYRLDNQDDDTESVLRALLRCYEGLFTDYVYIEEEKLSRIAGVANQQIYPILIGLSRQGIVSYIPRRRTPYITYLRDRVPSEKLIIPQEVYENRKKSFTQRIEAMIQYAEEDEHCRSRMLLHYFGERNEHNCGICDVCLHAHPSGLKAGEYANIRDEVIHTLQSAPEKERKASAFSLPNLSSEKTLKVVHYMLSEEILRITDGYLTLCKQEKDEKEAENLSKSKPYRTFAPADT